MMMSGCALCLWANGVQGTGKQLAEFFNIDTEHEREVLKILRNLSIKELYYGQEQITAVSYV